MPERPVVIIPASCSHRGKDVVAPAVSELTQRNGSLALSCSAYGARTICPHEHVVTVASINKGRSSTALGTKTDVWVHDCTPRHHHRRERWCRVAMPRDESLR